MESMLKLLTEIKGSKVILFQEQALVGTVSDYLFEHNTGVLLGVFVANPIEKKIKIIPVTEFKALGPDTILVDDLNSLMDLEDYIRGLQAIKVNAKIIGETVKTELGKTLGKVEEAAIDSISYKIERLYIKPKLGLYNFAKELLIPASKIIEITKKYIIVTDELVAVKAKKSTVALPVRCEH